MGAIFSKYIHRKEYCFYKITCLDRSIHLCYIGTTTNFEKRRKTHKQKCSCNNKDGKEYNYKIYKTIRENGGWNNFQMIQIGNTKLLTLKEAQQIEKKYIHKLEGNMNSIKYTTQ